MTVFQSNIELMKASEMSNVIKKYNILITCFVKYEVLHYQYWIRSFDEIFDCLNAPILLKNNNTQQFYVNFDHLLLNVLRESQLMLKLGLAIPKSCERLLLNEKYYKLASQQLQVNINLSEIFEILNSYYVFS